MSRLSRKLTLRSRKCHACHAKHHGVNSTHGCRPASADLYERLRNVTPVTQTDPARKCHACHAKCRGQFDPGRRPASADLYEGLQSVTPVPQIDPEVWKVPPLSRKTPRRQFDPGRRPASADQYEGLQSVTPEVSKVPRL